MNQDIKYYGLRNQGATCYLNSILQVLFMTREFREAIKSCSKHHEDNINARLHTLFESLKEKTSETTEVTKTLRIKVYEQQDAGQYLEKILSGVSDEASKIFRGKLVHRTVCDKCDSHIDDVDEFLFLSLPLMDSKNGNFSVEDGIQEFLKDVKFYGEDQMYCDQCEDNCDTTVKYKLECHPEILILLLKRYEYNYNHMSYSKDSRAVDVSFTINLPENQTYELYAMVDHFGVLTGGHYTATIKPEGEESWYEFNDSIVTKVGDQRFQEKIERSQSAQLLFYRKKREMKTHTLQKFILGPCCHYLLIQISDTEEEDEGQNEMRDNDCDKNHNCLYISLLALLLFVLLIIWIVSIDMKVPPNEFILFGLFILVGLAFLLTPVRRLVRRLGEGLAFLLTPVRRLVRRLGEGLAFLLTPVRRLVRRLGF